MHFLEKDLEQIIWESTTEQLEEKGLHITEPFNPNEFKKFRQLRIGNYGVSDLIYASRYYEPLDESDKRRTLEINIVELKKLDVNTDTLKQALRYANGLREYIKYRNKFSSNYVKYKITLVGRVVDLTPEFLDLLNFIGIEVVIYRYDYTIDGITFDFFEWEGYSMTNKGFENK